MQRGSKGAYLPGRVARLLSGGCRCPTDKGEAAVGPRDPGPNGHIVCVQHIHGACRKQAAMVWRGISKSVGGGLRVSLSLFLSLSLSPSLYLSLCVRAKPLLNTTARFKHRPTVPTCTPHHMCVRVCVCVRHTHTHTLPLTCELRACDGRRVDPARVDADGRCRFCGRAAVL